MNRPHPRAERSNDMSVNRIVLSGRLTADPRMRVVGDNKAVICNMRLAIQRRRSQGQDRGAVFIDVTTFDRQAQNCAKYLRKGARVSIDGRLEYSQWVADDGTNRSKHEVIAQEVEFLDPAKAQTTPSEPEPEDQPEDSHDSPALDDEDAIESCVGTVHAEPALAVAS